MNCEQFVLRASFSKPARVVSERERNKKYILSTLKSSKVHGHTFRIMKGKKIFKMQDSHLLFLSQKRSYINYERPLHDLKKNIMILLCR